MPQCIGILPVPTYSWSMASRLAWNHVLPHHWWLWHKNHLIQTHHASQDNTWGTLHSHHGLGRLAFLWHQQLSPSTCQSISPILSSSSDIQLRFPHNTNLTNTFQYNMEPNISRWTSICPTSCPQMPSNMSKILLALFFTRVVQSFQHYSLLSAPLLPHGEKSATQPQTWNFRHATNWLFHKIHTPNWHSNSHSSLKYISQPINPSKFANKGGQGASAG